MTETNCGHEREHELAVERAKENVLISADIEKMCGIFRRGEPFEDRTCAFGRGYVRISLDGGVRRDVQRRKSSTPRFAG